MFAYLCKSSARTLHSRIKKIIMIVFTVCINHIKLLLDTNSSNSLNNDYASFLARIRMTTKENYRKYQGPEKKSNDYTAFIKQ